MIRVTRSLLLILIVALVLLTVLLDLLPPIEKDTLLYHLAVPKLWLQAGGIIELPWIENSYFPMNLNLLYMIPLYFDLDIGAKFIHNFFGLLTALLIFIYLKKRLSVNWALLGALIYLATPLIVRSAASAYVDLGLSFFITAAVIGLIYWRDTEKRIFFILSALAMGLALGTKYNAFLGLGFLTLAVMWIGYHGGKGFWKSSALAGSYVGLALLLFAPWAIRNYVLTGNPTYPLMNGLWGITSYFPERLSVTTHALRQHMFGESYLQTLLIPIRFFFEGRDFSMQYFDGVLNPFLLLLPPFALARPRFRESPALAFFAAGWIVLVGMTTPYIITRYIMPALPLLSILSVFGLVRIWAWIRVRQRKLADAVLVAVLIILFGLNAVAVSRFWQKLDPVAFLTGAETRTDYLRRTEVTYAAVEYINTHTDPHDKVLLLMAGDRGYYLDRDYRYGSLFMIMDLDDILKNARTWEDVLAGLKKMGITHILAADRLLAKYIHGFDPEKIRIWAAFTKNGWRRLFEAKGISVYELTS